MSQQSPGFTLVLNAGGRSRRMGIPKALLPTPPHGLPLIQHIIRRVAPLPLEKIIVVTNQPEIGAAIVTQLPIQILPDAYPDTGPLGGLATALAEVSGWALVLACDLPLVNPVLLDALWHVALETREEMANWDAVVPVTADQDQPLHAFYHRRCLPAIHNQLQAGHYRANGFYSQIRRRRVEEAELRQVDPNLASFVNVNTPEEWAAIQIKLAAMKLA